MTTQISCSIIKPDAVRAGVAGNIIQRLEDEGFVIRACKKVHLTRTQAEGFYAVHRERPFFADLTGAWRRVAYAHRIPEARSAERLWSSWGEHFGEPA